MPSEIPSAAVYTTVPVGYGGLIYDILNIGNIIVLEVLPQTNFTSHGAMTFTVLSRNLTSAAAIR